MTPALDITRRAEAIERTFAAAFAALDGLKKLSPSDADRIAAAAIAHVRNAFPQALRVDLEPVALPMPSVSIDTTGCPELADGTRYRVLCEADSIVLTLVDGHGETTTSAMLPIEWVRMRADVDAVAAAVKP